MKETEGGDPNHTAPFLRDSCSLRRGSALQVCTHLGTRVCAPVVWDLSPLKPEESASAHAGTYSRRPVSPLTTASVSPQDRSHQSHCTDGQSEAHNHRAATWPLPRSWACCIALPAASWHWGCLHPPIRLTCGCEGPWLTGFTLQGAQNLSPSRILAGFHV